MNGDILMYFDQKAEELDLYLAFESAVLARFPGSEIKVSKTQISFSCGRIFACASLPLRRQKNWPAHCILISLGLSEEILSPRTVSASRINAKRWTNHILLSDAGEIDHELLAWVDQAHALAARPGRRLP